MTTAAMPVADVKLPEHAREVGTTRICYATVIHDWESPGIEYILPLKPRGQSSWGWEIPMVVLTEHVTVDELLASVARVGPRFGLTAVLREAVKAWARSPESVSPHRVHGQPCAEHLRDDEPDDSVHQSLCGKCDGRIR